ncbi:carph-isopro domain-containing protein [Sphingomonas sanguinis]|uniref:carph-isopro domain-containing protein n=1 Tax=Sphingomonas sanguinis TaxID=33051 RepID=UPI003B9677FB
MSRAIISACGGIRPLARALGHRSHTTVQGWWCRDRIPSRWLPKLAEIRLIGGFAHHQNDAEGMDRVLDAPLTPRPTGSVAARD